MILYYISIWSTMTKKHDTHTWLHLGDQLLVEETTGLLVKWAVDGNNITVWDHFFW